MRNRTLKTLCVALLCMLGQAQVAMAGLRPFDTDSLKQIASERNGQPFLLVMWSIDCPPCTKELASLGKLRHRFNDKGLVLIATDGAEYTSEVEAMLAKYGLSQGDNWIFSGNFPEQLRYHIDKAWYGELPRAYFYDARHQRIAKSGVLTVEAIQQWLMNINQNVADGKR